MKILVVEDDKIIREGICEYLSELDMKCMKLKMEEKH